MDYYKILDQINYAEKAEKSLKEFSNWIFGISIGVSSLLIFQIKGFDLTKYYYASSIYKGIVIYSMITIFFAGFIKYLILNRENKLSILYGVLLKLIVLKANKTTEELKIEWDKTFSEWAEEHNKLKLMSQGLNISIVLTLLLVFLSAIFIISII